MSKIKLNLASSPVNGQQISFIAPCSSTDAECLVIEDIEYSVVDADNVSVAGVENVWNSGAIVSAILNVDTHTAFIQNANTNTYLEGVMVKNTDLADLGKAGVAFVPTSEYGLYFKTNVPNFEDIPALSIAGATEKAVNNKSGYLPIVPKILDYAVKKGLVWASESTEGKLILTDEEKSAVASWLGLTDRAKIQTGSYEGTWNGEQTASMPKVLIPFNFVPKMVIIYVAVKSGVYDGAYITHLFNGVKYGYSVGAFPVTSYLKSEFTEGANDVVWDNTNKTVEFIGVESTNRNLYTYNWIAIG